MHLLLAYSSLGGCISRPLIAAVAVVGGGRVNLSIGGLIGSLTRVNTVTQEVQNGVLVTEELILCQETLSITVDSTSKYD